MDTETSPNVYYYIHSAFRSIIPKPEDRIPLTGQNWQRLLLPMPVVLLMAYLVRRPNTYLLRLSLLPFALVLLIRTGFSYVWENPSFSTYNFGNGVFTLAAIARVLEYGLIPNGLSKIDEKIPGQSDVPAIATGSTPTKAPPDPILAHRPLGVFFAKPVSDAFEVLCSMRGIGFEYGRGVMIPPETRPLEKGPFLWATLKQALTAFLTLDLLDLFMKLTPPLRTPLGGSIFMPSLPWPKRYLLSTAIHVATGCGIAAGFEMVYSLITLFAVAVLSHSPTAWPPVFDKPWYANSLNEYWAYRWHQSLRRTFMILGGFPGKWIGQLLGRGKNVGMLFGTFIGSGLFHELAAYALGRGLNWHPPIFFFMHAVFVLGERVFRKVTGRRVGGLPGRLWVYFSIIVLGQCMVDSWHLRGVGGGMIIPPKISPTRRIIFPLLTKLWNESQSHIPTNISQFFVDFLPGHSVK
ncbi:hypothetical protein M422DRAFT_200421 [Sphaerobolus stellatus SS14]|nr:hypothetical protein M422DRAFT_200421 [Sphaerobolus stellatus SS14]